MYIYIILVFKIVSRNDDHKRLYFKHNQMSDLMKVL